MATIADLQVKFSADTGGLESGAGKAQGLIGNLIGGAKGLATVAGGMVLGTAISQVIGSVGSLASAGIDFERQMANVNSIAQLTTPQLAALKGQVIDLAMDPRITQGPAQLAAGLYNINSSGFSGADAMNILEVSAVAATAGMTTTDVAAKAVTQTLNAYGLGAEEAGRISDVLFQTVNKGVITFPELAQNMGNTLPVASALGVSIEELGAAYALMTLKGVPASQAETQIASLMKSALNPTQALSDAMVTYGDGTAEATIANRGLEGYLKAVYKAAGGNKEALMDMLGTQEAVNAALILGANDGKDYNEMLKEMANSSGATEAALQKQMESSAFAIDKMKQSVQVAATVFMGQLSPAISFAANAVTGFIVNGLQLVDEIKLMHSTGGVFLDSFKEKFPAAFQPAIQLMYDLIDPLGDVYDAFQALKEGDFAEVWDELKEAAGGFADAFKTLGGTIWDAISAIDFGGIAASIWDWLSGAIGAINWGAVWDTVTSAITAVASAGLDIGEAVLNAGAKLGGVLADVSKDVWGWVKGQLFGYSGVGAIPVLGGVTGAAIGSNITIGDVILEAGAQLGGKIKEVAGNVWGWIKDQVLGGGGGISVGNPFGGSSGGGGNRIPLGEVILDAAVSVTELLGRVKTAIDGLVRDARAAIESHKEDIKSAISKLFDFEISENFGNNLGSRFGAWLSGLDWGTLFGKTLDIQSKIMQGIGAAAIGAIGLLSASTGHLAALLGGFLTGMVGAINWGGIKSAIGDKFREVFQDGSNKVQEAIQKISDYLGRELMSAANGVDAALAPAKTAIESLREGFNNARQAISDFGTNIAEVLGIVSNGIASVIDPIVEKIQAIGDAVKDTLGWLDKLKFWQDQNSGGDGNGRQNAEKPQGNTNIPGQYVTPNNTGDSVTNNGTLITNLPNVGAGPGAGSASGAQAILAQVQAAAQAISQTMSQISQSIAQGVQAAGSALQQLPQQFQQAAQGSTQAVQQMTSQVQQQLSQMTSQATQQVSQMASQVRSQMQQMASAAQQSSSQMASQVRSQFQQMASNAQQQMSQMASQVRSQMQQMSSSAQQTMTQFSTAVRNGFNQAADAARNGAQAIRSAVTGIGDLSGEGSAIGASFGAGIVAGLNSMIGEVAAAAANLVAVAAGAAQARGEISSPSRLSAREIGVPWGQGMALGMESQADRVARASASLIPSGGVSSSYWDTWGGSAPGMGQTVIQVFALDSDSLGDVLEGAQMGRTALGQISPRAREIELGLGLGVGRTR